MEQLERIHFLSRADKLKAVRRLVRQLAIEQGCNQSNLDCLVMSINEACMNVIQHAYQNNDDGEVILEFWKDKQELIIRIYDFGIQVDRSSIKSRDLDDIRPGGLGVHLIHQVMDQVEYKDGLDGEGNLLEMRKNIETDTDCGIVCDSINTKDYE
ncbi:MAG: ATP-binding protein [Gammaproteobacteria bacterium]|nr:ATP-binding protein [Gammaproteobacteria bacterium]